MKADLIKYLRKINKKPSVQGKASYFVAFTERPPCS